MYKIKLVIPINHNGLNENVEKEISRLKIDNLKIDVSNLKKGPKYIENRYEDFLSRDELIKEAINAEKEGYHGIYIDCFTEPGVEIIREIVDIPVVGAFAPALLTANLIATKYSIITISPDVVPIFEDYIRMIGQKTNIVSIKNVSLNVSDMMKIDMALKHLTIESERAIEEGAEAIILGCTGMLGVCEALKKNLRKRYNKDIPVINPTLSGIMFLYSLIIQNLTQSCLRYYKK
jgi:allantoin racemase